MSSEQKDLIPLCWEGSGFGQKKATFREFVFIFLGSLGLYVFLH